jgi:hypothetical protein
VRYHDPEAGNFHNHSHENLFFPYPFKIIIHESSHYSRYIVLDTYGIVK